LTAPSSTLFRLGGFGLVLVLVLDLDLDWGGVGLDFRRGGFGFGFDLDFRRGGFGFDLDFSGSCEGITRCVDGFRVGFGFMLDNDFGRGQLYRFGSGNFRALRIQNHRCGHFGTVARIRARWGQCVRGLPLFDLFDNGSVIELSSELGLQFFQGEQFL
jgi:hypothetical protein